MKLSKSKAPFVRSKWTTPKIMKELFISLLFVWIVAIIVNFSYFGWQYGLKAILIGLTSIVATLAVDVLVSVLKGKKKRKEIFDFIMSSHSYITAIIFALCLPVGTPIYVVMLGAIFATLIGKHLFGGFGYNIFNPAVIGRIFVGLAFANKLTVPVLSQIGGGYDLATGPTITGSMNWTNSILPQVYNYKDLLFGGYPSALGESFSIILIAIGIFLILRKIINWRLPASYLLTITLISFSLGLFLKVDNAFLYTINHLFSGGILFAAVFMISDPVTSTTNPYGKIIYGIGAGFLTMLIRVNSSHPEGVIFSIALMNMIAPTITRALSGVSDKKVEFKWMLIASMLIWSMAINVGYSKLITFANTNTPNGNIPPSMSIDENQYLIQRDDAYYGKIIARVTVDRENETITKFEVLENHLNEGMGLLQGNIGVNFYDHYIKSDHPIPYANIDLFKFDSVICNDVNNDDLTVQQGTGSCINIIDSDLETGATITAQSIVLIMKDVVSQARNDIVVSGRGFYVDPLIKLVVSVDRENELITKVRVVSMNDHEQYDSDSAFGLKYINLQEPISFDNINEFPYTTTICIYGDDGKCSNISEEDLTTGATISNVSFIVLLKKAITIALGGN